MQDIRYRIIFTESVKSKQLPKLSKDILKIILKTIDNKLTKAPHSFGKPLRSELAGLYSLRIGNYRVIYEIKDEIVAVLIVEVDHRKDVYKN